MAVTFALSSLGLAACTPAEGSPKPSPTRFFESDEAAISAVKALLETLFDAEEEARKTGDFTQVRKLTSDEMYALEERDIQSFIDEGFDVDGGYQDFSFRVIEVSPNTAEGATVHVAFCRDVSGARVVDAKTREDLTPPNRPLQHSLQVTAEFTHSSQRLGALDSWKVQDACAAP